MSYFTLKDGQRLYYEDKGHGSDTLIMMHGWTSTHHIVYYFVGDILRSI